MNRRKPRHCLHQRPENAGRPFDQSWMLLKEERLAYVHQWVEGFLIEKSVGGNRSFQLENGQRQVVASALGPLAGFLDEKL